MPVTKTTQANYNKTLSKKADWKRVFKSRLKIDELDARKNHNQPFSRKGHSQPFSRKSTGKSHLARFGRSYPDTYADSSTWFRLVMYGFLLAVNSKVCRRIDGFRENQPQEQWPCRFRPYPGPYTIPFCCGLSKSNVWVSSPKNVAPIFVGFREIDPYTHFLEFKSQKALPCIKASRLSHTQVQIGCGVWSVDDEKSKVRLSKVRKWYERILHVSILWGGLQWTDPNHFIFIWSSHQHNKLCKTSPWSAKWFPFEG
jgi:hypothetical protein